MPRKEIHVVPNSNGGWDAKRNNVKGITKHFDTKKEIKCKVIY